ncbi:MAG: alkaline phosphatase [Bacteroidales bacterium]|nr:alkaline phosphatase [Bacteroidales bacterium]
MKKMFWMLAVACLMLAGCQKKDSEPVVKNVIFMIGDGMGLNQAYAGAWAKGEPLQMMASTTAFALQETWSADNKVTDSAASGTAMACGVKTYNYAIGLDRDSVPVESILEQSARNGKATGIVVTCAMTHATPASFVAHQTNRNKGEEIAVDIVHSPVEVMIGGGRKHFEARKDSLNMSDSLRAKGFDVVYTLEDAINSSSKYLAAFCAEDKLPTVVDGRGDFLPKAVELAIKKLKKEKNGFFLMVEGSQIDMRCHSNDMVGEIGEMLDFDDAIAVALEFAKKDKHTLVVITADHETGGLAILQKGEYEGAEKFRHKFTTTGHTGVPVPIYAYGPGSENYEGLMQNSDHKAIMSRLMGLK